jgi:hypothetical protein
MTHLPAYAFPVYIGTIICFISNDVKDSDGVFSVYIADRKGFAFMHYRE